MRASTGCERLQCRDIFTIDEWFFAKEKNSFLQFSTLLKRVWPSLRFPDVSFTSFRYLACEHEGEPAPRALQRNWLPLSA